MLVHKSNPESIPTPLHSETVNIVDTYMYMVVETNEFEGTKKLNKFRFELVPFRSAMYQYTQWNRLGDNG